VYYALRANTPYGLISILYPLVKRGFVVYYALRANTPYGYSCYCYLFNPF